METENELNNNGGSEKERKAFEIYEPPAPRVLSEEEEAEHEAALQVWEDDHFKITHAISTFICSFGRMPTTTELACESGVESKVIVSHLEEFTYHPAYGEEIELIRMMSSQVLAKVAQLAVQGDMNAAKLYFKVVGKVPAKPVRSAHDEGPHGLLRVDDQNMWQGALQYLSPEQCDHIEAILKAPAVLPEDMETRNRRWEGNHQKMIDAISGYLFNQQRMPTTTELAAETGLSRQTITKHLEEFTHHPLFSREVEQFRSMTPRVLTTVMDYAVNGNIKAARLYFQVMKEMYPPPDAPPTGPNGYLLINNMRLDKKALNTLSPEQLATIVGYFRSIDWKAICEKMRLSDLGLSAKKADAPAG